jgi:hypothetical protein
MISTTADLTLQLLAWTAERPRTYGEAMEAWRTHCPRMPVWEDAVDAGLIVAHASPGGRLNDRPVSLTALGRATLAGSR